MNLIKPKTTLRDFKIVKARIIKKLLALPEGRFPSKRINSFEDIMYSNKEYMDSLKKG